MKKFVMKFGTAIASLALMIATVNVNATCCFHAHQSEVPEAAKKLRRF